MKKQALALGLLAWFFGVSAYDGTHWYGPYDTRQSCYPAEVAYTNTCTTIPALVPCQFLPFDPNVLMQPTPTPT